MVGKFGKYRNVKTKNLITRKTQNKYWKCNSRLFKVRGGCGGLNANAKPAPILATIILISLSADIKNLVLISDFPYTTYARRTLCVYEKPVKEVKSELGNRVTT